MPVKIPARQQRRQAREIKSPRACYLFPEPVTPAPPNFKTEPDDAGDLLLDFAVAGMAVTIRQGDTVFLSGTLPATLAAQSRVYP